jgi:hypothetical protein
MQERFYYYRDDKGRPLVTVCELFTLTNELMGTGIAICSPKDEPNKRVGRAIARQRAFHAFKTHTNKLPIWRQEAIDTLLATCSWHEYAEYKVVWG